MSEWEKGYVAGRAQAFAEMQQTVDRGMRESGADGGEAPESREEVSPVVRGGPGSGTAVPAPLSAPDASDDVREGQCPECRWTGGLHASGCSAVDAGADVCPHGGGPHFWVQGKASQGIICNRCETRRPADDVSAEPFSPEEEARDQLYLRLKGAREKLCVAQTLIGEVGEWATGREELQEALDRIDAVGARLCPKQWSRFDSGIQNRPADDVGDTAEARVSRCIEDALEDYFPGQDLTLTSAVSDVRRMLEATGWLVYKPSDGGTAGAPDAEAVALAFHEHYERMAPTFGYDTRPETRVAWEYLPENNRALMVAVVTRILADFWPKAAPSAGAVPEEPGCTCDANYRALKGAWHYPKCPLSDSNTSDVSDG